MSGKNHTYVLKGGKAGYDRLLLLARDRWPGTKALFERAGLSSGMHCADVGCGGGAVSLEMAKIVGPAGSVVGVDMDPVTVELARQEARSRSIENLEFRVGDADDWSEPGTYDVVYSRFLLQHLRDPRSLIKRMWEGVRPGGRLIVEDIDADGWFCEPSNDGFEFFRTAYPRVLRAHGGDPNIGRKLFALFLGLGIPRPELTMVQSLHAGGDVKYLPQTTLRFSADAIVSAGLATPQDVQKAVEGLTAFTEDPTTLISGPRIFQVWSRRGPSDPV
ncbi:MAG: class I SAM-dependent methyltransferase [Thermoplasmata archaeon]|nr:class I SAM-dependent methyltransferase [Thermoplasmata archaeon]